MTSYLEDSVATSKADKRRSEMARLLMERGTVQIKELTGRFDVSLMTIHRDLNVLEQQGILRRIRGAVTAEKSMLVESSYQYRARQMVDQKRRLARAAVRHIEPGNAVIWDESSTTFHVTEFIAEAVPVTVITNALPVLERLREVQGIDLIALGGKYNRAYMGFFGIACERAIRTLKVDVALMSTTTIQGLSIYTQDEQVVRAKQAMIEVARKKILLVDETKFQFSALNFVANLSDFDSVLLAGDIEPPVLDTLRVAGIRLERV
jgi:DeoR/GlpR family transcriptional regulator of sugar metabolism